jgi:nucleotide-binding universal stress UspA family protein
MDRLLVATDFSPRSDRALRRASLIARKVGASITQLHVVDADRPDRLIDADRSAASDVLHNAVSTMKSDDGLDANWLVKVDDVHTGIIAAADEISADLVAIGPHRTRLRDAFVGTTAERVVRRTTRPVLVAVETPATHHHNTLLALDFDDASKSAGRAALALGVFDHTDVIVMHAFDAPGEGMMRRAMEDSTHVEDYVEGERTSAAQDLRALMNEIGLPPTSQTVVSMNGTPARTILEAAIEVDSDLIVLGTNQRKGFGRVLIGSVTEDVIREAHRDVLIIPVDEPE